MIAEQTQNDTLQIIDDIKLIRIDKNLAKQGVDFVNTYGNDGQLIFDIFIYIANTFQNNLFNYGELDVKDFAEKLGYTVSNLKRQHPEPFQNSHLINKVEDEMNFTSFIENALYKASKINLEFSKNVKDYTNNEEIREIEFYQLVKKLRKHRSINRKNIFYYSFEVSDVFTYHLSKFFTLSNIDVLKNLRQKNCVFLYMYLKTLEEAQKVDNESDFATPYFDTLCNKAEINISNPSDARFKLTNKLKIVQQLTDLKFDFEFYNRSGKYSYGVKVKFPEIKKALNDPIEKDKSKNIAKKAMEDMVLYDLIQMFRQKYQAMGRLNTNKFQTWLYSDTDSNEKYESYFKTVAGLKNLPLDKVRNRFLYEAKLFFKKTV